jgi:hypothetical protein
VVEYANLAGFPATGETGKIYVAIDTGFTYRWSGSVYIQINSLTGTFAADAGTAAAPSISIGTADNGLYAPAEDQVAISTNGTQRLLIEDDGDINIDSGGVFYDATNNRLAIGAATPGNKLHVVQAKNTTGIFLALDFGGSPTAGDYTELGFGTTATHAAVRQVYDNPIGGAASSLRFFTNNNSSTNEVGQFDSSGRLLVGTSTAFTSAEAGAALVQIKGASGSTMGRLAIARDEAATSITSGEEIAGVYFTDNAGNQFSKILCFADANAGSGDYPGRLVFSTTADGASSPTERMRINSTGLVSISNGRLYIQNSDASNPLSYAYNTNNAASDVTYRSELGAGSNGTSAYHFYAVTGGSGKFAIYGNGTYGTISDQNLKTHIEPARDGYLADLNQIKIVKYGWKSDELGHATELGVIAQEVEQVFPGLVQECPPNEDGEVFKGVKTSVFTFMLIKALQEASSKIESLESRIAALEAS